MSIAKKRLVDSRQELERHTTITSGKEGLITIAVEDRDPKRAADLANAYVEELHELNQQLAVTEAAQRRLFFEGQLRAAKDKLADAEVAMKQTQERTGIIQVDAQAKAIIESVASIKAQIAAKQVQVQAMRSFATENNPDLVLAQAQLDALNVQLSKMQHQQGEQGDIQVPTSQVPSAGLEYVRRLRDIKYNEAIFELLAKQFEAAKLDEGKNAAVIQVVDPATVPERPSGPKRVVIVLLGGLLAAFLSVGFIAVRESIGLLKRDPEQQAKLKALKSELSWRRS